MLRFFYVLIILTSFLNCPEAQVIIQKKVLVEEFTSALTEICSTQTAHLDDIIDGNNNVVRIKYHTDIEGDEPFYATSSSDVDKRLALYDYVEDVPQAVIDGFIRPEGNLNLGASGNLSQEDIDSAQDAGTNFYFFGISHTFSDDYTEMSISGGGVSHELNQDINVLYTQAVIEEEVNLDQPIGPTGKIQYNYVFRKFARYRKGFNVPHNGSHHGWDLIDIPSNIKNLSKVGIVHIFEHNGKVVNTVYDGPFHVDDYKIQTAHTTAEQGLYTNNKVIPKLSIINRGSKPASEYYLAVQINDLIIRDTIAHVLTPSQEYKYIGDTIILPPGKHKISVTLEGYAEDNQPSVLNNDSSKKYYYVYGNFDLIEESFETSPYIDSIGLFMDKSEHPHAFINVDADFFNQDDVVGGFGLSEHSLMIDYYTWKYDFNNQDNNSASMVSGRYNLGDTKLPLLKLDVSSSASSNTTNDIIVKITSDKIIRSYTIRPSDYVTMPFTSDRYVPNNNSVWKTLNIDLKPFVGHEYISFDVKARVFTQSSNALYIDNIRVEDAISSCSANDFTFTRQTQIDSFPISYGACNEILGNVCLGICDDNSATDITDLSGLSNLAYIGGDLNIYGIDSLANLDNFGRIIAVGGSLHISDNPQLLHIGKLDLLQNVGGDIVIENNPLIVSLGPLSKIEKIKGDLRLSELPKLSKLDGFDNVTTIDGNLFLKGIIKPFSFEFESLNFIGGSITIDGGRVFNFFSAEEIDTIHGDFILSNLYLASQMNIFPNAKVIEGNVILTNMGNMRNLDWMEGVKEVHGNFEIDSVPYLLNHSGLNSLEFIEGNFSYSENDTLVNFDGLSNLSRIGGNVSFYEMRDLTNFDGLSNLDTISGDFNIEHCGSLSQLSGLENLRYISGNFNLSDNSNLENLNAISQLKSINGKLSITNNDRISNLDGLSNLINSSLSSAENLSLVISNNPLLTTCDNAFICHFIKERSDEILVQNNAPGCENLDHLIAACDGTKAIQPCYQLDYFDNPVNSILIVQSTSPSWYNIKNGQGMEFLSGPLFKGRNEIIVNTLGSGIYYVHIQGKESKIRFMK